MKIEISRFFRDLYKTYKINKFYLLDVNEIHLEKEVSTLFLSFISLTNEGLYQRFNSKDFYSKSSKIKIITQSICKLMAYIDLYPNRRIELLNLFKQLKENSINLEQPLNIILDIILAKKLIEKEIFIEIRNLIAQNWLDRNLIGSEALKNFKRKDLNYLNYSLEEYQTYLNNCFNVLVRDTKRFISRYPIEYKENPNLDLEIMVSLRDSIYNDIKFHTPSDMDEISSNKDGFNIFELFGRKENKKEITLRGWFQNKPNFCKINVLSYKAFKQTK